MWEWTVGSMALYTLIIGVASFIIGVAMAVFFRDFLRPYGEALLGWTVVIPLALILWPVISMIWLYSGLRYGDWCWGPVDLKK
jgi:hypothetical protein